MSQTPPFDQDQPPRRPSAGSGRKAGRDRGRSSAGRRGGGAPGEPGSGWDDGRGGGRTRSTARRRASGGEGPSGDDGAASVPRWAVPVGIAVVGLLVILVLLRACSGGAGRSDAGSCMTDLAAHLPASATAVSGTDFVQASKVGWDVDGSLEEIGAALEETGVIPDPVTVEYRINRLATPEQFAARTGMAPDDVECALSDGTRSVLSGSFDPPAVNGSQAGAEGAVAATDDLLAMAPGGGDAEVLLEPDDDPLADDEPFVEALDSLRDAGAYSVIVQRGDGDDGRALAAGVGAGGDPDERTVLLAWSFASEDDAKAGRPEMVNRVNSVLKGTLSITAADLVVDGNLVTATLPAPTAAPLQDLRLSGARFVDAPSG